MDLRLTGGSGKGAILDGFGIGALEDDEELELGCIKPGGTGGKTIGNVDDDGTEGVAVTGLTIKFAGCSDTVGGTRSRRDGFGRTPNR